MMNPLGFILRQMNCSPGDVAHMFAQKGYGDEETIRKALENGDAGGLNFLRKVAPEIMRNNPGIVQQAKSMLGMR